MSTIIGDGRELKSEVKRHWENETCGTRYGDAADRKRYFEEISEARYRLEPYIRSFAGFGAASGKTVLEIGVGAGADFQNWCETAAHATGIDLTEKAISLTGERLALNSVPKERYRLLTGDAENLPFDDNSFDIVYSWGVLHHTPDTRRAYGELFRVLKPGGVMKTMIYHHPSWTGLMLYARHALARGNLRMGMKEAVFHYLESPGTKTYTVEEAREMLRESGFVNVESQTRLGPGDLLTLKPSEKYSSGLYKMIWRIYPRWLVRLLGDRWGMGLLLAAGKPVNKE
jgi:ubiquinone/menaquinone biosynthesis C-methylase UbiE